MICGVPKLKLNEEVKKLVLPYGNVTKCELVSDYPTEEFTDAYYVHYARIQSARVAKRFIDGKNFYGGLLHVFYLPELETVDETRNKLNQRRKDVAIRIKRNQQDMTNLEGDKFIPREQFHRKKKTPALPLTEERLMQNYPGETLSSIYNGIPQSIDPRQTGQSTSTDQSIESKHTELIKAPYEPTESVLRAAGVRESKLITDTSKGCKRKNYKGQSIKNNIKVRIVRPQLIDTREIRKVPSKEKNIFSKVKKVESGIVIKIAPQIDNSKKRIVIKNPSTTQLVQTSENLQCSIQSAKSRIRAALEKSDTIQ